MKIYRVVYGYFSNGDMSEGKVVVELWPEKFSTKKKAQAEIDKFCKELVRDYKDGFEDEDAADVGQMFETHWGVDEATVTFNDEEYRTFMIIEEDD